VSICAVPTLVEVSAQPELIDRLPAAVCAGLVVQLAGLQQRLGARLAGAAPLPFDQNAGTDDLLDTKEAAMRLGISATTLRDHGRRYQALRVPTGGRKVRYSARLIAAFQAGTLQLDTPPPAERSRRRSARPVSLRAGGEGASA
jgi:hypothetical protein